MYKVLIVDDEKIVRIALKTMIKWEEYGFDIIGSVADGMEAMNLLKRNEWDVVITDLKMPVVDGLELIKQINEQGLKCKIIVLSNYDDFEFVKQALKLGALDYILKISLNADVLIKLLTSLKDQLDTEFSRTNRHRDEAAVKVPPLVKGLDERMIQRQFLKELMTKELYEEEGALQAGHQQVLVTKPLWNTLLYLFIEDHELDIDGMSFEEQERMQLSLINTIEENISGFLSFELLPMDQKRLVVLLQMEKKSVNKEQEALQLSRKIIDSVGFYLNVTAKIVYGYTMEASFESYGELRKKYELCINEESMGFYEKCLQITKAMDRVPVEGELYAVMKRGMDGMITSFEIGSIANIMNEIDKLFELSKTKRIPPIEFKKCMIKILELLENYLEDNYEGMEQLGSRYEDKIIFSQDYSGCRSCIEETIHELYGLYSSGKGQKYKKEVLMIMDYIQMHYPERLTLEMISEYMNMNRSYLCRLFKKETGNSIFAYLSDLRVDRAVQILKTRDLSIGELARQVGMEDQFYFHRVFKKKLGLSPTEFKKKFFERKESEED